MAFKKITKEAYIELYINNNPAENIIQITQKLDSAIIDYQNGIKCTCGDEIWVLGSASMGYGCFECIAGDTNRLDYYEIDDIDFPDNDEDIEEDPMIDIFQNGGFYNDDGTKINMDLVKKPTLCVSCIHDVNPYEFILCSLVRADCTEDSAFECHSYKNKYEQ